MAARSAAEKASIMTGGVANLYEGMAIGITWRS
jgi:hypothetical protein